MKRTVLLTLLLIPFFSGCSTLLQHHFDPSRNESTYNLVRASLYWTTLQSHGYIPGISTNQHGKTQACMGLNAPKHVDYPWETQLMMTPNDEPDVCYWYLICIPAVNSDLMMKQAWKTDAKRNVLARNLPLPSDEQQRAANEELRDCDELKQLREGKQ